MNFIILNNKKYFENKITLENFNEVDINGTERIDAVFAQITTEILESINNKSGGGDQLLPEKWLLSDGGVQFILCKIDRSILYNENEQLIEKMFRLFSKEHFFIELWNFNVEESYNQLDCFLIAYNKKFGYQEILIEEYIKKTNKEKSAEKDTFKIILNKIKEKIL